MRNEILYLSVHEHCEFGLPSLNWGSLEITSTVPLMLKSLNQVNEFIFILNYPNTTWYFSLSSLNYLVFLPISLKLPGISPFFPETTWYFSLFSWNYLVFLPISLKLPGIYPYFPETTWYFSLFPWNYLVFLPIFLKLPGISPHFPETTWYFSPFSWNYLVFLPIFLKLPGIAPSLSTEWRFRGSRIWTFWFKPSFSGGTKK